MITFSLICDRFLESLGYRKVECNDEEEARRFAAEMPVDCKEYPVVYSVSDTTGEKMYEEFYVSGEKVDMERFGALGVIESKDVRPVAEVAAFLDSLANLFSRPDFTKAEVVELIHEFLPNFVHEETGRNLDSKM